MFGPSTTLGKLFRAGVALTALLLLLAPLSSAQKKYKGPRPPKADVPFLLHADNLVELEAVEARESKVKDLLVYTIPGASSPARTPLAEPIFLFQSEKIQPDKLALFPLKVRGGQRVIEFNQKKPKDNPVPLRFSIEKLDDNLFKLELAQILDNGEYSFSPSGSNITFNFQVY